MRIYQVARKLKVKSSDVSEKLALLNINVAPSSKIDALTALKAEILIRAPLRVEKIAKKLDLSVEKLLKKLKTMKIEVISHLSLLHEPELVRLLNLKTLEKLKTKPKITKQKTTPSAELKVLKIKPKRKRVFEIAEELGINEGALLKKLRQMNALALHRRSPLDPAIVEQLKEEKYRVLDKIAYAFARFFNEIPELFESSKHFFRSTAFYVVVIVLLAASVSANIVIARSKFLSQKLFLIQGETYTDLPETYQVLETVALLEIKQTGIKFPIVEEGKDNSPITAVLVHKSTTVLPGKEGRSVIEDTQGTATEKIGTIKAGTIFVITDVEDNVYYYRVVDDKKAKSALQTSFKSVINLNLENGRKIVAVLQKIE